MINRIKRSREIKKSEASDFLFVHSLNQFVMDRKEGSFSRMKFGVCRLESIKHGISRQVVGNLIIDSKDKIGKIGLRLVGS